jgi:hypothetical protein
MAFKIICFNRVVVGAMIFALVFMLSTVSAQAACTIEEGIGFHNAARDGDKPVVEKAIECLENLEQKAPEDARLLAYLGSSYALKARYSDSIANKMRFTNLGLDNLDYAVELAPDDFELRLIRWNVNEAVPLFFGRKKHTLEDLYKLDTIFQANPNPSIAKHMVEVYASLRQHEPENAKWKERMVKAQNLAQ